MIEVFKAILPVFLIFCALAVSMAKNLLSSVVIFSSYSLVMAIIWQQLNAPDIAMTEAAIGAGVTTLLLITVISRTGGGIK